MSASQYFKRISCDNKQFWNIPTIGIGTYRMKGNKCEMAIKHALQTGYRHIDTAECYQNYSDIANGIKLFQQQNEQKNDDESNIFITSKLSPKSMKSIDKVESSINDCLKSLNIEYIDLFLIHWPGVSGKKTNHPKLCEYRLMAWKVMEKYVNKGLIRCIGVSNFEIHHLKPLIDGYNNGELQYKPAINQFEFHPLYQRYDLFDYCYKNNITVQAYGSLGAAESHWKNNLNNDGKHVLLNHPLITEMSKKYNKTAAQILIRYGIEHDCVVIPKSKTLERIQENFNVFDFKINKKDLKLIDQISNNQCQRKFAWNSSKIL